MDSNAGARSELKTLNAPIVGEVGDIINGHSTSPPGGITIFHSMGMAFFIGKIISIKNGIESEFFIRSLFLTGFYFSLLIKTGMAVEDVAVGQAVFEKFQNKSK